MKTPFSPVKTLLFGAGALATSVMLASGQSAFTTPVGYHTETISPGFNVLAPNLVDAPLVSSALTGVTGETLTDADVDFTAVLTAEDTYTIEFANGAWSTISPGAFTATSVTTDSNLMDAGVAVDDTYIVRKVRTLGDFFGSTRDELPEGWQTGDAVTADVIWIPEGESFTKAYFADADDFFGITEGWKLVSTGNDDQTGFPVPFTKGLIIQRQGDTPVDVTFTGHVKLSPTMVTADAPFTYLSRVYPTGVTLGNSGLADSPELVRGDATTATNIWIPEGDSFTKAYYALADDFFGITEGWKLVSTGNDDQTDFALGTANIIQRRTDAFDITLTPPDFYADL